MLTFSNNFLLPINCWTMYKLYETPTVFIWCGNTSSQLKGSELISHNQDNEKCVTVLVLSDCTVNSKLPKLLLAAAAFLMIYTRVNKSGHNEQSHCDAAVVGNSSAHTLASQHNILFYEAPWPWPNSHWVLIKVESAFEVAKSRSSKDEDVVSALLQQSGVEANYQCLNSNYLPFN